MAEVFDIIFAGGGTAACVVAGRLAAADPTLKILILEAGKHTFNVPAVVQPALYVSHIAPGSTTATFHTSKPSEHLDGRAIIIPTGKAVGGGSAINFMMYTRASASDYDEWENVHGNPGWSFKHLEPLFKKSETYQAQPNLPSHGYSGPLHVSWRQMTQVGESFLRTGVQYESHRKLVDDSNDFKTIDSFARWAKWIDKDTGRRSDAAHYYIYNQSDNHNLDVRDSSLVVRVIIQDGRAVGVEYINEDPNSSQAIQTAMASRLVVVSAGSFGSPPILERSGVGARTLLEKHGVECIVDLPGVGENYRDHNGLLIPFKAKDDTDTLDSIFRNDPVDVPQLTADWEATGNGLIGHNGCDACIKIRPTAADLKEIGPAFTAQYQKYFEHAPDKPVLMMVPLSAFYGDPSTVPARKYFSIAFYTEYPASTGSLHIASGTDPRLLPDFDSGFFKDPADLAILRWGYKRCREYARRMYIYRGELEAAHPDFTSPAAITGQETMPVPISEPDIVYTAEDDARLETYTKKFVSSTWHALGTCAMKARDHMGVVDNRLNVYGVRNLKVADLSIAPSNVAANTYSTTLVIGEKAAIIIAEELGIRLSEV